MEAQQALWSRVALYLNASPDSPAMLALNNAIPDVAPGRVSTPFTMDAFTDMLGPLVGRGRAMQVWGELRQDLPFEGTDETMPPLIGIKQGPVQWGIWRTADTLLVDEWTSEKAEAMMQRRFGYR